MNIELVSKELIHVTPEERKELFALLNVLGIKADSEEFITAVMEFTQGVRRAFPDKACKTAREANGGWCRYSGVTDYLNPYWEIMEERLGAKPFDIDLIPGLRMGNIIHTHYIEELRHDAKTNQTHFTIVSEIFGYIGEVFDTEEKFLARAAKESHSDIQGDLGEAILVPEFIECGNGMFRHNPNYPGGATRYRPVVGDSKLLLYMANEWLARFATPGQRERVTRIHRPDREQLDWFNNRSNGRKFNIDNCNGVITFEEFKKL